jgi:hypothetical protein
MSSGLRLGFGDEAKDAVNFMEYGENLPPIFIRDTHLMILANLGGFAKKCCRHVNEAMNELCLRGAIRLLQRDSRENQSTWGD